jgi:hypothetical protein
VVEMAMVRPGPSRGRRERESTGHLNGRPSAGQRALVIVCVRESGRAGLVLKNIPWKNVFVLANNNNNMMMMKWC